MGDFVAAALGLDKEDPIAFKKDGDYYLGYKVMQFDPKTNTLLSGANKRLRLPLGKGKTHTMPGAGIFMSDTPENVVDYYSFKGDDPEDPDEVVLQYAFKLENVGHNRQQLGDRNAEIGVSEALLKDYIPIDDWNKGKRFNNR